jgi:hypothetical protein
MSTRDIQLERRAGQRFDFHVRVSVRIAGCEKEGTGFTQNLSAKGILFQTDFQLAVGDAVEIIVVMPSEITLGENMRVRCRGKVLRVTPSGVGAQSLAGVQIEGYEYLPDTEAAAGVRDSLLQESVFEETAL